MPDDDDYNGDDDDDGVDDNNNFNVNDDNTMYCTYKYCTVL